jgi:UDP-galactopyranose mutase
MVKKKEVLKIEDEDEYMEPIDLDLVENIVQQYENEADIEFIQMDMKNKVKKSPQVMNS